jgi:hypothetical protein
MSNTSKAALATVKYVEAVSIFWGSGKTMRKRV